MMTIKHIAPTCEEFVYPATHTTFWPEGGKEKRETPTLFWWDGDGNPHQISDGAVFIMNEHGRTVARYQLLPALPV